MNPIVTRTLNLTADAVKLIATGGYQQAAGALRQAANQLDEMEQQYQFACGTNRVFVERLHEGDLVYAVSGGPRGRVIDAACGWTTVRYANGAEVPYRHGTDRLFLMEAAT